MGVSNELINNSINKVSKSKPLISHLREPMKHQHEGLGPLALHNIVELDSIGRHVLMVTQGWVTKTVRG